MAKKGGGNSEAAQARADEQQRQQRVREGTTRVNGIFDGGMRGTGQVAAGSGYDTGKTYYRSDGTVWSPQGAPTLTDLMTAGSGGNANPGTPEQQFAEALKGGLYSGTEKGGGFDDQFYKDRRQAYLDYATPQLDDQFADASKALTYQLARQGLLDSSVRADKTAELQKKYDLNKQQIGDQALSYETESRTNVEKARSDLIAMLNATGDAEGAANSALARSQALSAPQSFSPLTQLFGDFTSALGQQAQWERNAAMGGQGGRYNTGLFSNSKSVKVS